LHGAHGPVIEGRTLDPSGKTMNAAKAIVMRSRRCPQLRHVTSPGIVGANENKPGGFSVANIRFSNITEFHQSFFSLVWYLAKFSD
jgi:hypothetical protein